MENVVKVVINETNEESRQLKIEMFFKEAILKDVDKPEALSMFDLLRRFGPLLHCEDGFALKIYKDNLLIHGEFRQHGQRLSELNGISEIDFMQQLNAVN